MKTLTSRSTLFGTAALLLSLLAAPAATQTAQPFPTRPVRLVVPFAAGGPADAVARTLAPALEKALGQPVLVDNRAGADGIIGAQAVLAAPPDGHTLLFATASLVPLTLMKKAPPFDLRSDFAPVSRVARSAWAVYVSNAVPARTLEEFVAHARANPGKLNYASSTLNDFLAARQFMKATGTELVKVTYKGAGQALPDLVAGRVHVNFSPLSSLGLQQAKSGQLRLLAIVAPQRSPLAPDVPTLEETGLAGVTAGGWLAIAAPARTPRAIIERLQASVEAALSDSEVRAALARQAVLAEASTPQALTALVEEDFHTWATFIRENGLVPE